jgi:hypothetical protein
MITHRKPIELSSIGAIDENKPDNIFVCWGSTEERCKGSILKLASTYKVDQTFLLSYDSRTNKKRQDNIKEITEILIEKGKLNTVTVDENTPLPTLRELCEQIHEIVKHESLPRITIDITSPMKWHLLIFLKYLNASGLLNQVRFIYTEPHDYEINLFQSLSFGIKEIFPVPTFYGDYDFSKDDLLVLMLGYEGSRAIALHEDIDPADCLLLIADPPYRPEWRGRTELLNKEILNLVGNSKVRSIDARNPMKVAKQLKEILGQKEFEKYNHIISPIGTKPQTLGLYLYLNTCNRGTILIYGAPLRHNELFYSSGIGRTWELPV